MGVAEQQHIRVASVAALQQYHVVESEDDARRLEHLVYRTHGYAVATYVSRVHVLLHAAERAVEIGAQVADPVRLVATLDVVSLRTVDEQQRHAAHQATLRERAAKIVHLAAFDAGATHMGPAVNRCARCGCEDVTYYQQQTRSADEGITTFCTCEKCGKRWRQ